MSASKRAREMSTHCPLTKAREGAEGRLVCDTPLASSKGCKVTVERCWAAFTAEEEENQRCDKVDDFHMPWDAQAGKGGRQGQEKLHVAGRREKALLDCKGLQMCFTWGLGDFSIY